MFLAAGILAISLATVSPTPWFTDITESSGIPSLRHGEGVVAVDLDGDDLPELYLPCVRDKGRLLKNLGKGLFKDITEEAGLDQKGGVGAAVGDLNGDGRPDLYIVRGADPYVAPNLVYLQQSDGSFRDVSQATGIAKETGGLTVTLADFNGDGHTDAFVPGWTEDRLYQNNGNGTLSNVSQKAGIAWPGRGWASLASDFNGDGHLDIFTTHGSFSQPRDNHLYFNQGDGTFTEVTTIAGLKNSPWSLGAVSADFDNDGDFDLYVGSYSGLGRLYRNEGAGQFTDVTKNSGLTATKIVGAVAGQINDDLLTDIAVAGFSGPTQIFKNLGEMKFLLLGEEAGLQPHKRNEGLTLADLDEDGDLDLYVSNVAGNNRLYQNQLNSKHFLKIRIVDSILPLEGTVARLYRSGTILAVQELAGAVGMGQGPPEFLFRLPDNGSFDLSVTLPGGHTIDRKDLKSGVLNLYRRHK